MPRAKSTMNGTIRIDHGIPLPPRTRWPWESMEVGDSFKVDTPPAEFRGGVYGSAKNYGIQVATRAEGNGVRVWRVK